MRPAGLVQDVYCGSAESIDALRAAAGRMAREGDCPVRIHRHGYREDCASGRHELVGSPAQLTLEGFVLPAEVSRGRV